MNKTGVALAGALVSTVWLASHALAQTPTPCVTQNMYWLVLNQPPGVGG